MSENVILGLIVVFEAMRSRSRSQGVKIRGHLGQGQSHFGHGQANAQDIGRWAPIKAPIKAFLFHMYIHGHISILRPLKPTPFHVSLLDFLDLSKISRIRF